MTDITYTLGAVGGHQNGRPFYQATVPFRTLASMLKLDDDFDVTKRSQRIVDKNRAKKVAKYLDKNKDGFYVLPPLVGFIDGDFEFVPVPLDGYPYVGTLKVPLESKFMLFDGQHRAFGVREAMQLAPELGQETISIMFFSGLTLSERQQAFHDINFTQKTPSAALCIAYNERSDYDKMVIDVFSNSHIRGVIEYEKNTASGNSEKVYSLKVLKDFAIQFCGKEVQENSQALLSDYVDQLFEVINIPAHLNMIGINNSFYQKRGDSQAKEYRQEYILPHAVTLKALGLLGKDLITEFPDSWQEKLLVLGDRKIFYRNSQHWFDRCVNDRDKMVSNQLAVRLTYYKLKDLCGLALAPEEKIEEAEYFQKHNLEDVA